MVSLARSLLGYARVEGRRHVLHIDKVPNLDKDIRGYSMSKDHDKASHGSQDARRHKIDHQIRNEWLHRDAGLQGSWRASGRSRDEFIRHSEGLIDKVITDNLDADR